MVGLMNDIATKMRPLSSKMAVLLPLIKYFKESLRILKVELVGLKLAISDSYG